MEKIHLVYYPKFKRLVVHRVNANDALIEVYDNVRYVRAVDSGGNSCERKWRIFFRVVDSTQEICIDGVEVVW